MHCYIFAMQCVVPLVCHFLLLLFVVDGDGERPVGHERGASLEVTCSYRLT